MGTVTSILRAKIQVLMATKALTVQTVATEKRSVDKKTAETLERVRIMSN